MDGLAGTGHFGCGINQGRLKRAQSVSAKQNTTEIVYRFNRMLLPYQRKIKSILIIPFILIHYGPTRTDRCRACRIRKLLLRFAHIQLPDRPDLAEDLVQETMLSAYRAAEGFKGGAQVSSWLFAILKTKSPTACAKSGGNAKFSSRATKKP